MKTTQSNLDHPDVCKYAVDLIKDGQTNASIVKAVYDEFAVRTSESSVKRFRKRHNIQIPGTEPAFTKIAGDVAEGATAPTTERILDDPDTMLRQRGLDPTEWYIDALRANEYQGPASAEHTESTGETKVTYYQTRFTCKRIEPQNQIVAPRTEGWVAPSKAKFNITNKAPKLVVVLGDQQAPFQDDQLHQCFLSWLDTNQPQEGVALGDTVDFPDISRWPEDPENTAKVNECLQVGYDTLRGYVDASHNTQWRKLPGNHDERIRNLLLSKPKVRPLYGIKRPDTLEEKGEEVLSVPYLLRLDELGIEYIDPRGAYDMAEIHLSSKLAVRHGWIVRQGAGASALESLKHTGYSIVVGHTHRQSLVHKTTYDINNYPKVLTAVETGCMCRLDIEVNKVDNRRFPSYTPLPDWQAGFATATIYPDGMFRLELATYVNGVLLWRDQRYSA